MTKRLLKTRKDHREARAMMEENTGIAQTMTPAAGALTAGTVGVAYGPVNFALSAPVGTAFFAVASGQLPAGLTLSSSGVLEGTPTEAVTNRAISITGSDAFGNSAVNAYTLTIAAA